MYLFMNVRCAGSSNETPAMHWGFGTHWETYCLLPSVTCWWSFCQKIALNCSFHFSSRLATFPTYFPSFSKKLNCSSWTIQCKLSFRYASLLYVMPLSLTVSVGDNSHKKSRCVCAIFLGNNGYEWMVLDGQSNSRMSVWLTFSQYSDSYKHAIIIIRDITIIYFLSISYMILAQTLNKYSSKKQKFAQQKIW